MPPSFLTKTYAVPAPKPPYRPIRAGMTDTSPPGRIMNKAPINAITVARISISVGTSFNINIERI